MDLLSNSLLSQEYYTTMSGEDIEDEDIFNGLVNFVTALFEDICDRDLKARNYSFESQIDDPDNPGNLIDNPDYNPEKTIFDGIQGNYFYFPTYPVNSISQLKISGEVISPAAANVFDSTTEYYLYNSKGRIYYYMGFDYGYLKNIMINWNGGYSVTSPEFYQLQHLAYSYVNKLLSGEIDIGSNLISESLGNYKYRGMSPSELKETCGIPSSIYNSLIGFRRIPIG